MGFGRRRTPSLAFALAVLLVAHPARAANLRASPAAQATNSQGVITEGVNPEVFTTYDLVGTASICLDTPIDQLDLRTWALKMTNEQFKAATPISKAHHSWSPSLVDSLPSVDVEETVGVADMQHHFRPRVYTKDRLILFSERTTGVCNGFVPCDLQITFDNRLEATSEGKTRYTLFIGAYLYNRLEVPLAWLQFMQPIMQLHAVEEIGGFGNAIESYAQKN